MKNITTTKDLEIAVTAIVAGYELNDPINEDYQLEWKFYAINESCVVEYKWNKGITIDLSTDPTTSKDSVFEPGKDGFTIAKTSSYRKLAKEVIDAINNVTSKEFEVLKFSETI